MEMALAKYWQNTGKMALANNINGIALAINKPFLKQFSKAS